MADPASPPAAPPQDVAQIATTPAANAAVSVALGILSSRLLGLVREKVVAYFFGVGAHLDVYQLVMKGANLLNNLLGEGTLSASFIPIYSRMLEEGRERDAGRFAGAILGLLLAVVALVTGVGVLAASWIVTVLAPGFTGDAALVESGELSVNRFDLAVYAIRITLPMAAFLVLSAWALGVLNSHRRFFLPYFAPTMMNVAVIVALLAGGMVLLDHAGEPVTPEVIPVPVLNELLIIAVFGALIGGFVQFLVQLPLVFRLMQGFRLSISRQVEGVREAVRAFGPVLAGRGVAQISSFVDVILAGLATAGTLGALRPALVLYMLPVSLFGMSVAASELPELSRVGADRRREFPRRIERSTRQMLYLIVPTIVGYLVLGFLIVGAIFGGGAFDLDDTWLVYLILAGYTLGLGATSVSRLLQNSFYALNDTSTPARIAVVRVFVSGLIGAVLMFWFDRFPVVETLGLSPVARPLTLAAVGLALGSSCGAWVELAALRIALGRRVAGFTLPLRRTMQMGGMALVAMIPAVALRVLLASTTLPIFVQALLVVGVFGLLYLSLGHVLRFDEGKAWTGRFLKRFRHSE